MTIPKVFAEVTMLRYSVTERAPVVDRIHGYWERVTTFQTTMVALRDKCADLGRRQEAAESELATLQDTLRTARDHQQRRQGGSRACLQPV